MFRSTGSGAIILLLIPSIPAASAAAIAMYGLAVGSPERSSSRVSLPRPAGTRTNGVRLDVDQATYVGAS